MINGFLMVVVDVNLFGMSDVGGDDASFWRPPSDRVRVDLMLGGLVGLCRCSIGCLASDFKYEGDL
jgi:hypothetical protein